MALPAPSSIPATYQ
jgi:hypothetical protein